MKPNSDAEILTCPACRQEYEVNYSGDGDDVIVSQDDCACPRMSVTQQKKRFMEAINQIGMELLTRRT